MVIQEAEYITILNLVVWYCVHTGSPGKGNKIRLNRNIKSEIKALLEEQIAFHYDLEQGRAKVSLPRDEDVAEAKKVLRDTVAYHKIFLPI